MPSSIPKFFCAITLAIVCYPASAVVTDCELNGKSVSPYNGATTAGQSGIMRCVNRQTRELVSETELKDGKTMGLQKYYEKGQLQREYTTNEKGNRDGLSKTYGADGKLLSEEQQRNSENFGLQKRYYPGGVLRSLSYYDTKPGADRWQELASIELNPNGSLNELRCADRPVIRFEQVDDRQLCGFNGLAKLDLYSGERKAGRIEVLHGKRQLSENLWEDGKVRYLSQLQGNRHIEKTYARSGALAREIESALVGNSRNKEIERAFHESGSKISEKRWAQGQLTLDVTWYLNGQTKSQDEFSGEQQKTQRFHDNGSLAYEGTSIRERNSSRRIGVHRHLNEKGRLVLEQTFDERGKITRERRLDETGQVLNDDAVFEDGSRRAFSK